MKMSQQIRVCLAGMTLVVGLVAGPVQAASEAEIAYQGQQYGVAQQLFKQALVASPHNPDVLYNLGNTYYKQGAVGKAIASYLKAQRFRPRDRDIRANLVLAQKQVIKQPAAKSLSLVGVLFGWLHFISLNELLGLSGMLSTLMLGCWVGWLVLKRPAWLGKLTASLLIAFVVVVGVTGKKWIDVSIVQSGVIINPKAAVKSGPSASLQTMFFAHEGSTFTIVKQTSDWAEIRMASGLSGWLPRDSFQVL